MRQRSRLDGVHQRACHALRGQRVEPRQLQGTQTRTFPSLPLPPSISFSSLFICQHLQLSNLEVHTNGQKVAPVSEARASTSDGFLDAIENYMSGHDVSLNLPLADAKITVSARNLANDELSLNLQLNNDNASDIEARGKKGNIFKKGGLPPVK